jgi:S-adenosylmethionine:tRNA ribosyltransferase-isomerase
MYQISEYTYFLPPELIAQEAVHPQHDARLIVIDREDGSIFDESTFWHLDQYIPNDRVIFFNNSRVLPARIRLRGNILEKKGNKKGLIHEGEILFLSKKGDQEFEALVRPGRKFGIWTKIFFGDTIYLEVTAVTESGRILKSHGQSIEQIMRDHGELPLPPYIKYKKEKEADYQTAFANKDGSVAAPTASLHFTEALLGKLQNQKEYLTLHVGLGTFQSINTLDIRDYHIHSELVEVPIDLFGTIAKMRNEGKKILAVGTTACRTLESLPYVWQGLKDEEKNIFNIYTRTYWDILVRDLKKEDYIHSLTWNTALRTLNFFTSIYLYPGSRFLVVDDLITNFHLPESSLLVLVSAFLGRDTTMEIYEQAIREKYRFFSFWDGMYIRSV